MASTECLLGQPERESGKSSGGQTTILPRVVVFSTGGTIAMMREPATGQLRPILTGEEIANSIPALGGLAEIEVRQFSNIDSTLMTPGKIVELTREMKKAVQLSQVNGIVVTHGTDTMEESAFLTALLWDMPIPVVFTGSQRSFDDTMSDGPQNLLDAVRVASAPHMQGMGVVVVFASRILAARDVAKTHLSFLEGFDSGTFGILGYVDGSRVVVRRRPVDLPSFPIPPEINARVDLIKYYQGIDGAFVDASIEAGSEAIVIEAAGRGNVTEQLAKAMERAIAAGALVVVTSRVREGLVAPEYGSVGGGAKLEEKGAILAPGLTGVQARLLIMVALANGYGKKELKEFLQREN
ncbi:MAG: asparaginase [bacterium]